MLTLRVSAIAPAAVVSRPRRAVALRSMPQGNFGTEDIDAKIEAAKSEAAAVCKVGHEGCEDASEVVNELLHEKKEFIEKKLDAPMDAFCDGNEDADECRVFDT